MGGHPPVNGAAYSVVNVGDYWWSGTANEWVLDHNYLFGDGHVKTYYRIVWPAPVMDQRMMTEPWFQDTLLPKE